MFMECEYALISNKPADEWFGFLTRYTKQFILGLIDIWKPNATISTSCDHQVHMTFSPSTMLLTTDVDTKVCYSSWDEGEDSRYLHLVTDTRGHKAGHTLDIPLTISTLTVQSTSRVPLKDREKMREGGERETEGERERTCFTNSSYDTGYGECDTVLS